MKPLAFARQHNRPDAFEPRPTSSDPHAAGDVKVDVAEPEPYLPQAVSNPDPGLELLTAPGEEAESPTVRFVLEDWNPHTPVRSIRISLEPRELGALRITLLHRGGQVHARMVVENTQALQVVQAQAQALQAALSEQGLVFGTFSVTAAANATWAGLPAASALRPDRGDPEKRRDAEPEPSTRTEVKTT